MFYNYHFSTFVLYRVTDNRHSQILFFVSFECVFLVLEKTQAPPAHSLLLQGIFCLCNPSRCNLDMLIAELPASKGMPRLLAASQMSESRASPHVVLNVMWQSLILWRVFPPHAIPLYVGGITPPAVWRRDTCERRVTSKWRIWRRRVGLGFSPQHEPNRAAESPVTDGSVEGRWTESRLIKKTQGRDECRKYNMFVIALESWIKTKFWSLYLFAFLKLSKGAN